MVLRLSRAIESRCTGRGKLLLYTPLTTSAKLSGSPAPCGVGGRLGPLSKPLARYPFSAVMERLLLDKIAYRAGLATQEFYQTENTTANKKRKKKYEVKMTNSPTTNGKRTLFVVFDNVYGSGRVEKIGHCATGRLSGHSTPSRLRHGKIAGVREGSGVAGR